MPTTVKLLKQLWTACQLLCLLPAVSMPSRPDAHVHFMHLCTSASHLVHISLLTVIGSALALQTILYIILPRGQWVDGRRHVWLSTDLPTATHHPALICQMCLSRRYTACAAIAVWLACLCPHPAKHEFKHELLCMPAAQLAAAAALGWSPQAYMSQHWQLSVSSTGSSSLQITLCAGAVQAACKGVQQGGSSPVTKVASCGEHHLFGEPLPVCSGRGTCFRQHCNMSCWYLGSCRIRCSPATWPPPPFLMGALFCGSGVMLGAALVSLE